MNPYLKALRRYIFRLPEKFGNVAAKFATSMLTNDGFRVWNPPTKEKEEAVRAYLARIGREAATMCFGTFKRILGTISFVLILAFLFYEPFKAFITGSVLYFLTIALVLWVGFALLGRSPRRLFSPKKRS